jgi:adenosine deaminase
VVQLVNNSFEASWLPAADKQHWLGEVGRIHAQWQAAQAG